MPKRVVDDPRQPARLAQLNESAERAVAVGRRREQQHSGCWRMLLGSPPRVESLRDARGSIAGVHRHLADQDVSQRVEQSVPRLWQPTIGVGNRGGARIIVGLQNIAIELNGALTELFQIEHRPQ